MLAFYLPCYLENQIIYLKKKKKEANPKQAKGKIRKAIQGIFHRPCVWVCNSSRMNEETKLRRQRLTKSVRKTQNAAVPQVFRRVCRAPHLGECLLGCLSFSCKGNCAHFHKGGWWYNACAHSNLNGVWYRGGHYRSKYQDGVFWAEYRGGSYSLRAVQMMIKPIDWQETVYHWLERLFVQSLKMYTLHV